MIDHSYGVRMWVEYYFFLSGSTRLTDRRTDRFRQQDRALLTESEVSDAR